MHLHAGALGRCDDRCPVVQDRGALGGAGDRRGRRVNGRGAALHVDINAGRLGLCAACGVWCLRRAVCGVWRVVFVHVEGVLATVVVPPCCTFTSVPGACVRGMCVGQGESTLGTHMQQAGRGAVAEAHAGRGGVM